jgi:hypothetical protein
MAKVQPDSAASMPGSRRWRRIGCLTGKSRERVSRGNHQGQSQHRHHFSFHVEHFVSHYAIIAQRHAQVLCPLCLAFNEEIVRGGDLFRS